METVYGIRKVEMADHKKFEMSWRKPILQALQNWFAKTYDVGTGILDERVRPLTFETNHRAYCTAIRLTSKGLLRCRHSDARLVQECKRVRDIVWHVCDNGLLDFAVPITWRKRIVAYFFAGQLRGAFGGIRTDGGLPFIGKIVSDCGVATKDRKVAAKGLETAFSGIRLRTPDQLAEINQAARRFAKLLSWVITKMAQWQPAPDILRIYLQKAVHAKTVDELLELSVYYLPKIIGAKHCSIFLVGEDVDYGERLILRKTSYKKLKTMENSGFYAKGVGLTGWVWRTGRSLRLNNASDKAELAAVEPDEPPKPSGHLRDSKHLREFLCVPLMGQSGTTVGVLRAPTKPDGFNLDDEIALSTLGEYLYSLIESCQSREREADVKKALDMALSFQRCVTEVDVWARTVSSAVAFWGKQEKAYLLNIIDHLQHAFTTEVIDGRLATRNLCKKRYNLIRTTTGYVVKNKTSILIHDVDKATKMGRYIPAVRRAISGMAAPICPFGTTVIAVMAVVAGKQYAFYEKDKTFLTQLCQCASEAIERIRDRNKAAEYEKLVALSSLLTGLRHDLGTPMEYIDVYLREHLLADREIILLSDFILTGLAAYQFVPVASSKEQFLGLDQSLRERVGRFRAKSFPLRQMLENCIRVLDVCFRPLPKCHIICSSKYLMKADPQLMMLVLYNLIKNARQHTPKKGLHRKVVSISVKRKGNLTIIEVSDGNRLIKKRDRDRLFQFWTLDDGHGLQAGLALARLFVQAHPGPSEGRQGVISYNPRRGRNVFSITIRG